MKSFFKTFYILFAISFLTGCGKTHTHLLKSVVIKAPTHLEEGIRREYCETCDYFHETPIEKIPEHTFDKMVVDEKYKASDATETEPAKYYYSCECGEKGTLTFSYGEVLKDEYIIHNGNATINDNNIISNSNNTVLLIKDKKLEKGTLSAVLTPNNKGDNGLIFNVSRGSKTTFFEEGVSYYFYFINKEGFLYLGKVDNGSWFELFTSKIDDFSVDKSYTLEVSFDSTLEGFTKINCFLDNNFVYSERDSRKITTGYEYGIRLGTTLSKITKITKSDTYKEEEIRTSGELIVANGNISFDSDNEEYCARSGKTLAFKNDELENGVISAKIRQSGTPSCNGLIFGLENYDRYSFWQGGILYYYFFIDERGNARLAKVSMDSWTDLAQGMYVPGFSFSGENTFRVERDGLIINCYLDNIKEPVIRYTEGTPLLGKYYGVRLETEGAKARDLKTIKNGGTSYKTPENYNLISGEYLTSNNNLFISSSINNIALHKLERFEKGTISLKLVSNSPYKTGIIFRSNENATEYYKFVIWNNYCQLFKVVNGVQTQLSPQQFVTASHNNGSKETVYVSIDEATSTIRCYIRDILYAVKTEQLLEGTYFGLFAEGKSGIFEEPEIINEVRHDKAKTLVFGHSYMELWDTWQSDLSMFENVKNIGIGGSVAAQWNNLEDEIVDYAPETGIFMIGINDLTGSAYTPTNVYNNVKSLLTNIKNRIPSLNKLVLLSCNRCPAREEYINQISSLNSKFRFLVEESGFEWVKYGDLDNAFLDLNNNPLPSKFKDGLHPTADSYQEVKSAILKALDINI